MSKLWYLSRFQNQTKVPLAAFIALSVWRSQNSFIGPASGAMISWTRCSSPSVQGWLVLGSKVTSFCFSWGYTTAFLTLSCYFWYICGFILSLKADTWVTFTVNIDHGHPVKCLNHDAPNLISDSYLLIKCECRSVAALISTTTLTPQALTSDKEKKSLHRTHMTTNLCKCTN